MHSSYPSQPPFEVSWTVQQRRIAGLHWPSTGGAETPVLALHGWLDNAASFVPLAPHLANLPLYAIDWAGHGHSDHRPPGCGGGFINNLEDLLGVLTGLDSTAVDLIGHSMGGALACLFAAAFPERVRRLVLIEALGPMSLRADRFAPELRRGLLARRDFNDRRRLYSTRDEPIAARMAAGNLSERAARLLIERGTEVFDEGVRFRSDPRETLPSLQRGSEDQVLAALTSIQCPVQVILADPATSYLSGPQAELRLQALRAQQVHRVPGNHHVHMESAPTVAALIVDFLRSA